MQYHATPCNTMQYHAIPCNTMQYHASLITADGAYHCPVGSIMAIFISMPIPSFNLRYCQVLFMLTELIKVTIESHPSHFISCNLAYLQHKLSTGWTNYSRWLITSCQLGCFSHPPFTLAHTGVLDRGEARARDARASRPPSAPRLTLQLSKLKDHNKSIFYCKISFWF